MSDSLSQVVVKSLSALPLIDHGAWISVVTAREHDVLWRFVCEKSVWRLEAAPSWAPAESFDADLLARHYLGHGLGDPATNLDDLMRISISDLVVNDLWQIRGPVVEAFRQGPQGWPELRDTLMMVGRRRDFELFGRPVPPGAA